MFNGNVQQSTGHWYWATCLGKSSHIGFPTCMVEAHRCAQLFAFEVVAQQRQSHGVASAVGHPRRQAAQNCLADGELPKLLSFKQSSCFFFTSKLYFKVPVLDHKHWITQKSSWSLAPKLVLLKVLGQARQHGRHRPQGHARAQQLGPRQVVCQAAHTARGQGHHPQWGGS